MARASLTLACRLAHLAPSRLSRAARRHDDATTRPSQYQVRRLALKQPPCDAGGQFRAVGHILKRRMHGGLSRPAAPSRVSCMSCFTMGSDTNSDGDDDASTNAEAANMPDRVSSWGLEASLSLSVEAL